MSAPLWQVFFSTLGGTLVGFFLALLTTAVRERPSLTIRVHGPLERVYVTENRPASGRWSFTVVSPDEATEVVLTVELTIANASAAYDSLTDVALDVAGTHVPARVRADSAFQGVNVPPRQTVFQRVRFFLPRPTVRSRDNLAIQTPDWLWAEQSPWPDMNAHWHSVRRHLGTRSQVGGVVSVSGSWMTLHEPGVQISYLHAAPA